jgi:hypothetical protein
MMCGGMSAGMKEWLWGYALLALRCVGRYIPHELSSPWPRNAGAIRPAEIPGITIYYLII